MVEYGPEHVNTLRRMVARHLDMAHEFVCVTDDAAGLDPAIRVVDLWDDCIALGGCYNRLKTFAPEMRDVLGPRFVCIDLDCVIVDDITPLLDREDDFIINSYKGGRNDPDQLYNGGMYMMDAGARSEVWESWRGESSIETIEANQGTVCTGSDQGWIRLVLGEGESRWTEDDGTWEARQVKRNRLRKGARIVFFAGPRDPTQWSDSPWVREHYR